MISATTSDWSSHPAEFRAYHAPALERHEVIHGLILNALAQARSTKSVEVFCWTLGGPGECAIKMGDHSIVLGALDENQCRGLGELTVALNYPGVIGPDLRARLFTDRAQELGMYFLEPEPQQIYAISDQPRYPGSPGHPRPATMEDATILADWLLVFRQEAVPHDCERPTRVDRRDRAALENIPRDYGRLYPARI